MIFVYLATIVLFCLLLVKGADITVNSLTHLSKSTKAGGFILSALLIAVGTSLPELFIAITSSLNGSGDISLGNVLGANITNITFVCGLSAVIFAGVKVQGEVLKRDIGIAMLAGLIPFILIFDKVLTRVDGLILLSIYGVYASSLFRERYFEIATARHERSSFNTLLREITVVGKHNYHSIAKVFIGLTILLVSADFIVRAGSELASLFSIPVFIVGLVILSLGTTLPELAFSIKSLRDHHPTMFFGNLLGSVIANSTLVIGVAATIAPIKIDNLEHYGLALVSYIISFILFAFFTRTKQRLDRFEAILLLAIYIIFVIVEFM